MKKQTLLLLLAGFLSISFVTTSCSKKDDPKVEKPDEQDPDGEGSADVAKELKGSDYYVITLDETSFNHIKNKVKKDYRPTELEGDRPLYFWEDTYEGGTSNGPNIFGEVEEWVSLSVKNPDWSGAGFFNKLEIDFTGLNDDYVFHFAIKDRANTAHTIIFYGDLLPGSDKQSEAEFVFGSGEGAYKNFTRDGEWHHVEIPVKDIKDKGVRWDKAFTNKNMLAVLSGGGIGKTLDIDAMFFYKKAK